MSLTDLVSLKYISKCLKTHIATTGDHATSAWALKQTKIDLFFQDSRGQWTLVLLSSACNVLFAAVGRNSHWNARKSKVLDSSHYLERLEGSAQKINVNTTSKPTDEVMWSLPSRSPGKLKRKVVVWKVNGRYIIEFVIQMVLLTESEVHTNENFCRIMYWWLIVGIGFVVLSPPIDRVYSPSYSDQQIQGQ